ncbi:PHP domain-containing protein, partial [Candidatus Woesearchaeota archaeon]|nr:PHP domain-containing protein [Candidatus Woesearchaeota archaeon]
MIGNRVFFGRPKLNQLVDAGYYPVDMHFHTKYSDGINSVNGILKKCKKKNIGIAIADHNEIKGSLQAMKQKDVLVIPATELSVLEGFHLLFYFYDHNEMKEFYDKYVKNFKTKYPLGRLPVSMAKYMELAKDYNCVYSIAHPSEKWFLNFARVMTNKQLFTRLGKVINKLQAIEVICGQVGRWSNFQATMFATTLNTMITAGSDGHGISPLGKVVSCAFGDSVEEHLNAVRNKQNIAVGLPITLPKKIITNVAPVTKYTKYWEEALKPWNWAKAGYWLGKTAGIFEDNKIEIDPTT